MRVKFQADADLDGRILRGLRRAAPEIDIRTAAEAGLTGPKDPEVLRIAADSGRILVSQDRRTMPAHFALIAPPTYLRKAHSGSHSISISEVSGVAYPGPKHRRAG